VKQAEVAPEFAFPPEMLKLRTSAVEDIILSEEAYARKLKAVDEVLLTPLEEVTFLSANDQWSLVANLRNIVELHVRYNAYAVAIDSCGLPECC